MRRAAHAFIGSMLFIVLPVVTHAADIADCADLQNISNDLTGTYEQIADIDCADVDFVPLGTLGSPFTGTYDGSGFVITNLIINQSSTQSVGIFGSINSDAVITRVSYISGQVIGNRFVGAIVGANQGGAISKSMSRVNVTGTNATADLAEVGGLVGYSDGGSISDSFATGTVTTANNDVGGLAGYARSTISNSYATGRVSGGVNMGGLVGRAELATIQYSFAAASIGSDATSSGGIIGAKGGSVTITGSAWLTGQGVDTCYEGGNSGCTSTADVTDFYSLDNAPLDEWDAATIWQEATRFPVFLWSDGTPPSAPSNFAVAIDGSDIHLTWTNPTDDDFTDVSIYGSTTDYIDVLYLGGAVVTGLSGTSRDVSGLADDVYYYSIFAHDSSNNYSDPAHLTFTIDTVAPDAPTNVTATVSENDIALTWTNPPEDFASVTIRRSYVAFPASVSSDASVVSGLSGTSWTDSDLGTGDYYYSIFTLDGVGNVSPAATVRATVSHVPPQASHGGGRSGTFNGTRTPTPSLPAVSTQRSLGASPIEIRTCNRVMKWFRGNRKMLDRVNARLKKRFSFVCAE